MNGLQRPRVPMIRDYAGTFVAPANLTVYLASRDLRFNARSVNFSLASASIFSANTVSCSADICGHQRMPASGKGSSNSGPSFLGLLTARLTGYQLWIALRQAGNRHVLRRSRVVMAAILFKACEVLAFKNRRCTMASKGVTSTHAAILAHVPLLAARLCFSLWKEEPRRSGMSLGSLLKRNKQFYFCGNAR